MITNQTKKVSVIIPVYNVEEFLRECLDSVINQTYKNLEIILIDDGSTDGSGVICDEYEKKDKRIKVAHQENKGVSKARNAGYRLAGGDYVIFLDSDDIFDLALIEKMLDVSLKYQTEITICKEKGFRDNLQECWPIESDCEKYRMPEPMVVFNTDTKGDIIFNFCTL